MLSRYFPRASDVPLVYQKATRQSIRVRAIGAIFILPWLIWGYSYLSLVGGGLAWGNGGSFLYVSRGKAMWVSVKPLPGDTFDLTVAATCAEPPFDVYHIGAKRRFFLHGGIDGPMSAAETIFSWSRTCILSSALFVLCFAVLRVTSPKCQQ